MAKRFWRFISTAYDILCLIWVWGIFVIIPDHSGVSFWTKIILIGATFISISDSIDAARGKNSLFKVVMKLMYCFLFLLGVFSFLYFAYGTTANFNVPLTHFDAFYFALGTLMTGTGNINGVSDVARYLQAAQMGLDLILIGFAASLAVSRFTATRS